MHIWINDDKVVYLAKKGIDVRELAQNAINSRYDFLKAQEKNEKEANKRD